MSTKGKIGVLALQGAFSEHIASLEKLGLEQDLKDFRMRGAL
jgi:glutamine amidotransferase PdxT